MKRDIPVDHLGEIVAMAAKLGKKREAEQRIAAALNEELAAGRLSPRALGIAPRGVSQFRYDFSRAALEELLDAPLDHLIVGKPDRITVAQRITVAAAALAVAQEQFGAVSNQQAQNLIDYFLRTGDDQVLAALDDLADLGCRVELCD